jgi:DNA-binding NarL/FixJ family response regulator
VVDRFSACRLVLAAVLEQTPDLVLCGQADATGSALQAVGRLKPDVVVTEAFSQEDILFVRRLRRRFPRLRILVSSFRDEDSHAPLALEAGADGFLAKSAHAAELVGGIRDALEGRLVLSERMRARLLAKCLQGPRRIPRCAIQSWARN